MHIEIAQRLKPFTHLPGTYVLIPGSLFRLQVFPALIRIEEFRGSTSELILEVGLNTEGPVDDFTVIQDIESGCVCVFGQAVSGYFRFTINASLQLFVERTEKPFVVKVGTGHIESSNPIVINQGESIQLKASINSSRSLRPHPYGRLSLGSHRSQDWELMLRREELKTILPIWHALGQWIPGNYRAGDSVGTLSLLDELREIIKENKPEYICNCFHKILLTGFEGALSPRLRDNSFNGICLPEILPSSSSSPLRLLQEGADLIHSLFTSLDDESIHLLPHLPPEFHCGRYLNVPCGDLGYLDLEWTKKQVRRVIFNAQATQSIRFLFYRDEKSCRIRTSDIDRGFRYLRGMSLEIIEGQSYWLDNFES